MIRGLAAVLLMLICGHAAAAVPALAELPPASTALTLTAGELAAGPAAVRMALPDGRRVEFVTRYTRPAPGLLGVSGRSMDGDRLALFLAGGHFLGGDVFARGGHYRLVQTAGRLHWAPAAAAPGQLPFNPDRSRDDGVRLTLPRALTPPAVAAPGPDGVYTIDVLAVYTPLYEARFGSADAARADIQRQLFIANTYFENSFVPVRYVMVAGSKYTGTQESAGTNRNLAVLAHDPAIAAARDALRADLVAYFRTHDGFIPEPQLGTLFNHGERNDPPQNVVPERDGFVVVSTGPDAAGRLVPDFVLPHELGHTLGGGHEYAQDAQLGTVPGSYWKPYAHGWQCGIAGPNRSYVSVMSYGLSTLLAEAGAIEARGDFFSTPRLSLDGIPCGLAAIPGGEADLPGQSEALQADNARAITEAAPYVAGYR